MNNINFGIDLGTTNSAIAKYENGKVSVFKNPVGFKDSLPSVVSFRKGKIQIGDKAREHIVNFPDAVFSSFKRKMGSDHKYFIEAINETLSPIDLSAKVLNELKNFVNNETLNSAVITIPASFDTIQSNATKKAGLNADIKEVVLLQEPIAACLAYSNFQNLEITEEKKWLVYDFGGGTFDVAIVKINERELKVIDHKGNNFLGGVDIDNLIVEKLICPQLENLLEEDNIWDKMIGGKDIFYKKLYLELLFKAEEMKKELSVKESASIEIDIIEKDIFEEIDIDQVVFNHVVKTKFDETFDLIEKLLSENQLKFNDIERIIMVGGTTYIPYIREELKTRSGIEVDSSIDPTSAVVIGAAYYAGNKMSELVETKTEEKEIEIQENKLEVEWIYETSTKDTEELLAVIFKESKSGYFRIIRNDGGFDSGMMKFENRISEFIPLLAKASNVFTVYIYDLNEKLLLQKDNIKITNGLYNISGQPLPNDICLELDDENGKSYLERIFKKNDILPLRKSIYKTSSKTILKNSDDKLIINVVEGNAGNLAASNIPIGYIEIGSEKFNTDLIKGMEVELEFKISESRDLSIEVYISSLDLEINEVFNPSELKVSINKIAEESKFVLNDVIDEIEDAEHDENYEYLSKLKKIKDELENIYAEAKMLELDLLTERKYQLADRKRIAVQDFDDLTRHKHILNEIEEYHSIKQHLLSYIEKGTPSQKSTYEKLIKDESEILSSNNKHLLKRKTKQLENLLDDIYFKQDDLYYNIFFNFRMTDVSEFKSAKHYNELIDLGINAMQNKNILELKAVCNQLYSQLINKPKNNQEFKDGNLGLR